MKTLTIMALALVTLSACSRRGGAKAEKPSAEAAPEASAEQVEEPKSDTPAQLTCGDTTCDPATEKCEGDNSCVARGHNEPMRCGDETCTAKKPLCIRDEGGGWACVGSDHSAIFKNACLSKDNCAEGQVCCKGMSSRCVAEADCGGGDTPVIACAVLADCPDSWYGNPVTKCEALEDDLPGVKICR